MSKAFSKLKDPRLGLTDVLPIGKYKGCRVCDVLDDWEYLKWMHSNTSVKFQQPVLDKITAEWSTWSKEAHFQEEVAPYTNDNPWFFSDMEDDIPF